MTNAAPKCLDKLLWGVMFTSGALRDPPVLLGGLWHDEARQFHGAYEGEPSRALLFCTRREARHWCAETMRTWRYGRQHDDIVARWIVRPVRVRETVTVSL